MIFILAILITAIVGLFTPLLTYSGSSFGPAPELTCTYSSIAAVYTSTTDKYAIVGTCRYDGKLVPFTTQGGFDTATGKTTEHFVFSGPDSYSGALTATMGCIGIPGPLDPWLTRVTCLDWKLAANGGINYRHGLVDHLYAMYNQAVGPLTRAFAYNRDQLLAKQAADLKAEADAAAAAQQKQNKRILQAAQPGPALFAPAILSPNNTNARSFFVGTNVPIKIAAPQGIAATSFLVKIEVRNAQGAWITKVTNLAVSIAEASSPTGYLGWGAPGNGKGEAMISGVGHYRISAQVVYPKPTVWSQPVNFDVTDPKKAIQRGPKLF